MTVNGVSIVTLAAMPRPFTKLRELNLAATATLTVNALLGGGSQGLPTTTAAAATAPKAVKAKAVASKVKVAPKGKKVNK